ncbi:MULTISPECIES: hypothetical protein [unclassified Leucobacter]|uniref:hypothetical protein n=1 Tax=unclassified Leucobacter TaxID=2621730 RepID=UPI00301764D0
MSTREVTVEDRNAYAGQAQLLAHAKEMHADSVSVELDMGEIRVSLADALIMWDDLAPGEGFEVLALHFDGRHDLDGLTVNRSAPCYGSTGTPNPNVLPHTHL